MKPRGGSRALYLELAARGVCLSTRRVPASMSEAVAKSLWERVRANGEGLREVLRDRRDPDLLAVRQEGGMAHHTSPPSGPPRGLWRPWGPA